MREVIGEPTGDRLATQAVKANGLVFTKGTIGLDPVTGDLPNDLPSQTRNTLAALEKILTSAGTSLSSVLKVNVYLDDVEGDFDKMKLIYGEYFRSRGIDRPPARTTVGCRLPWAKIEMDMVAVDSVEEASVRRVTSVRDTEPYSPIVSGARFAYLKSQAGTTEECPNDSPAINAQVIYALSHLESTLGSAGLSFEDANKINVYLARIDRDFDAMDAAYQQFFASRGITLLPARTTIGVPLAWPHLLVQMDVVATE